MLKPHPIGNRHSQTRVLEGTGWRRRAWLIAALLCALCLLSESAGLAHSTTADPDPRSWWLRWTFPPLVMLNLALAFSFYGRGVYNLWRKGGVGKGISRRQVGAFGAGLVVLLLALASPIDALSDELSYMHMIQHMLLMNVAAPMLVLGSPGQAILWVLPLRWRQRVGQVLFRTGSWKSAWYLLWQPVLMWSIFAFALWIWHLPVLYEAALANELFHDFQHFTFLVAAVLFWRVLLDPVSRLRLNRGVAVIYLFTTSLHATVLGVFMALAPKVWYSGYAATTGFWNLSPLEDQQLAGLIMWMPACMVYAVVAAVVFVLWLEEPNRAGTTAHAPEAAT
jgi:putative membrane protein